MGVIVAILGIIGLAAIGAWLLAWNNCLNVLRGPQLDIFCGHNIPLQLIPLFFLLLVLFVILAVVILRLRPRRRAHERQP